LKQPGYRQNVPTSCKEYGASAFLMSLTEEIKGRLKGYFSEWWREVYVLSLFRLIHNSALKHAKVYYEDSWVSEEIQGAMLSNNSITRVLNEVGRMRQRIADFMKGFISGQEKILIDLTNVFSLSEEMSLNELGYNAGFDFRPQAGLLFLFSFDKKVPLFYRILPGSVRDVKALKITIQESGIEDVVVIGDKGFYSRGNRQLLGGLSYILPLKRKSSLIDYRAVKSGGKNGFDGYFSFRQRFIWYYGYEIEGAKIWVYVDDRLRASEQEDYLFTDRDTS
jgi:transposase